MYLFFAGPAGVETRMDFFPRPQARAQPGHEPLRLEPCDNQRQRPSCCTADQRWPGRRVHSAWGGVGTWYTVRPSWRLWHGGWVHGTWYTRDARPPPLLKGQKISGASTRERTKAPNCRSTSSLPLLQVLSRKSLRPCVLALNPSQRKNPSQRQKSKPKAKSQPKAKSKPKA